MSEFLTWYLVLINIFGFFTMLYDKKMAEKNKWRVEEKTLFTIAAVGGSIGIYAGMYTFKHKTLHASFVVGIPLLFICNLVCLYFIITGLDLGSVTIE
ncbi:MAG: DUF1294 domain-containing protein [Clostridia bacterium]|nr:DUF1294 domain-containing protein [Clostridia bacterium]